MAPSFVTSHCDILGEQTEPHGAGGGALCGEP
jgi:hypothetical protein